MKMMGRKRKEVGRGEIMMKIKCFFVNSCTGHVMLGAVSAIINKFNDEDINTCTHHLMV